MRESWMRMVSVFPLMAHVDSAMRMLGKNFGVQQLEKTFELAKKN